MNRPLDVATHMTVTAFAVSVVWVSTGVAIITARTIEHRHARARRDGAPR